MEIKLKIERLEGGRAFLRDDKGRLIVWPRDFLPETAEEKETISFHSDSQSDSQRQPEAAASAKDILNEIFSS